MLKPKLKLSGIKSNKEVAPKTKTKAKELNQKPKPRQWPNYADLDESTERQIITMMDENLNFTINVNHIIGNLGPVRFNKAVHAISTALYILQKKNAPRYTINILYLANKILKHNYEDELSSLPNRAIKPLLPYQLNQCEVFGFLYYIEQHLETIKFSHDEEEIITWSIRDDIYKNACENDEEEMEEDQTSVSRVKK